MNKFVRNSEKEEILGDLFQDGFPCYSNCEALYYIKSLTKGILENIYKTHTPIHVSYISFRLENFIEKIKLDKEFINRFAYECHFNRTKHSAIVPLYLLKRDDQLNEVFFEESGIRQSYKEIILNKEYMIEDAEDDRLDNYEGFRLSKIQTNKLGSSYTMANLPSDGASSFKDVLLELESGDFLICKTIIWYNN